LAVPVQQTQCLKKTLANLLLLLKKLFHHPVEPWRQNGWNGVVEDELVDQNERIWAKSILAQIS